MWLPIIMPIYYCIFPIHKLQQNFLKSINLELQIRPCNIFFAGFPCFLLIPSISSINYKQYIMFLFTFDFDLKNNWFIIHSFNLLYILKYSTFLLDLPYWVLGFSLFSQVHSERNISPSMNLFCVFFS